MSSLEKNAKCSRVDIKALSASAIYDLIDYAKSKKAALSNYKVIFYTTIGTVTGTWLPLDEEATESQKDYEKIHERFLNIRDARIQDCEQENLERVNDTASLTLVDVTIQPYGLSGKHHVPYLILFADQIVGITFGEEKEQSE